VVGGSAPPPGASTFARADQTDRHIQLSRSGADAPPKHVLVCAPSNAAIDEIVSRLLQRSGGVGGLLDGDGTRCAPSPRPRPGPSPGPSPSPIPSPSS